MTRLLYVIAASSALGWVLGHLVALAVWGVPQ